MFLSAVWTLILTAPIHYVCSAINVTVTPSPFTVVAEGENITLSCQVTQRRRSASLPVVRWMFQPESGGEELLVARVNMQRAKFYGNYTKSFSKPKMKLTVVKQGKIYNLLIMDISEQDRGLYSCRVQEFKQHRERWKASTNSSASTQLRGLFVSFPPQHYVLSLKCFYHGA
uniref:V-set and transmembrane domain containing 4b n=1 Tax=Cyprinus carpio carpio TaxID=630221 RepID=A0A8C1HLS1_CYPCA